MRPDATSLALALRSQVCTAPRYETITCLTTAVVQAKAVPPRPSSRRPATLHTCAATNRARAVSRAVPASSSAPRVKDARPVQRAVLSQRCSERHPAHQVAALPWTQCDRGHVRGGCANSASGLAHWVEAPTGGRPGGPYHDRAGLTNGAVARRLYLSPHTVNTHIPYVFA